MIRRLVPTVDNPTATEIVDCARKASLQKPFAETNKSLVSHFSKRIFSDKRTRRFPELTALAFFMREAALQDLEEAFGTLNAKDHIRAPRGLAFHIAPGNVDTIFVYSWMLSLLCGNSNIVRVSRRGSEQTEILCDLLNQSLSARPEHEKFSTQVVTYPHDAEITSVLSRSSDLRIIWGGDATVQAVRSIALSPQAREIVFPDRSSLAVINAGAFLSLAEDSRKELVHKFYNDVYWFDQMACSSPRMLVWVGSFDEHQAASSAFYQLLKQRLDGYTLPVGAALSKMTATHRAVLDDPVTSCRSMSNQLTVLELDLEKAPSAREHPGFGTIYQFNANSLDQLTKLIQRKDQTITHFGFEADEVIELAQVVSLKGVERVVPFGQALSFHRYWDGYDLLAEMTRLIHIVT